MKDKVCWTCGGKHNNRSRYCSRSCALVAKGFKKKKKDFAFQREYEERARKQIYEEQKKLREM